MPASPTLPYIGPVLTELSAVGGALDESVSHREWTFLLIVLTYSFVPTVGGLLRIVERGGGAEVITENPRVARSAAMGGAPPGGVIPPTSNDPDRVGPPRG